MSCYNLITMAFLLICSSSFIEKSSAARSKLLSATNPLVHPQSEPVRPQSESVKPPLTTTTHNNNAFKQSKDLVAPPYPFYYPLSGPGYGGYPYYGQPGQPYLPNYRFPPVYPYSPYPTTNPYSSYNPTLPYPQGPSIYTPPLADKARP